MDFGWWECTVPFDENAFGFLYKITRKETGEYYVGIKQLKNKIRRKPLKGKKRARLDTKESDWRHYSGSGTISDEVKQSPHKFLLEIIGVYYSKRELKYAEAEYLITNNCLLDPKCYNEMFSYRLRFDKKRH